MKQLTEKEFREIYFTKSSKKLAEEYEVTRVTIRRWAKKFGLPYKRKSLIKR